MTMSTVIDAAPADTDDIACPKCGNELQVTASVWLSVLPDGRVVPAFGGGENVGEEMTWYCSNNHDTSGVALTQGLYVKVSDYLEERVK